MPRKGSADEAADERETISASNYYIFSIKNNYAKFSKKM
jgi:hypothetical protein